MNKKVFNRDVLTYNIIFISFIKLNNLNNIKIYMDHKIIKKLYCVFWTVKMTIFNF